MTMKKIMTILSMMLMLLGMNVQAQTWDFTTLDANDAELLEADIAAGSSNWFHSTESKKNRYSFQGALDKAPLMANGQELAYTKGLLLTIIEQTDKTKEGNFRAGNDASNKRAWMAGGSIVIPNLKKGYLVTVNYMSSSKTDARGIAVTNLTVAEGSKFNTNNKGGDAKDALTDTGIVTEDGDVTLTMTKGEGVSGFGMYLYMIKVEDPSEDAEEGGGDEGGGDPTPATNDYSTSANSMKNQVILTLTDDAKKYYNTENVADITINGQQVIVNQGADKTYTYDNQVLAMNFKKAEAGQQGDVTNIEGKVKITESRGWLESAYVKFEKLAGAKSYNVYVKGGQYADYTKIDNELVRDYGTYGRADVVGIKEGTGYAIKIVPVNEAGDEQADAANEATGINVKSYSRQGFAFKNGYVPGAYKADGTLKDNAKVLYITKNTAATVSTPVKLDAKKEPEAVTGFQAILDAYQKGIDKTPIAFRFIGLVEKDNLDGISSSEEGIQIKGKNADAEMPITIEGIGDDATVRGFGFLVRNSKGVEFRNIGVMRCMDDGISLDTDNSNIWIHHTDIFYGKSGSGDHGKGDGATDVKADSKYVTVSYNRYWDTGKTNMFGMKSETGPNYISYDHNWFDHSDSRHPRIRTMSVHVWNNYFDNVAKYGVGACNGSSVFVENNYFLKTKKPILSSLQGTDGMGAKGTFSGENGGMIKAFGNYMDKSAAHFSYYTQNNPSAKGYDAYEVTSRDAQIASTEKTLVGGTAYDNFDTDASLMYDYTVDATENVPDIVTGFYGAGRMNHGDLQYTLKDNVGVDDTDSAVDAGLASAIDNYKSSFVGFFGETSGGGEQGGEGGEQGGGQGGEGGGQGGVTPQPTPEGTIECWFENGSATNSFFTTEGSKKDYTNDKAITYNGKTYTQAWNCNSSGKIKFTTTKAMKLTIALTTKRNTIAIDDELLTATAGTGYYEAVKESLPAGEHVISKGSGSETHPFYIKLEPVE